MRIAIMFVLADLLVQIFKCITHSRLYFNWSLLHVIRYISRQITVHMNSTVLLVTLYAVRGCFCDMFEQAIGHLK